MFRRQDLSGASGHFRSTLRVDDKRLTQEDMDDLMVLWAAYTSAYVLRALNRLAKGGATEETSGISTATVVVGTTTLEANLTVYSTRGVSKSDLEEIASHVTGQLKVIADTIRQINRQRQWEEQIRGLVNTGATRLANYFTDLQARTARQP